MTETTPSESHAAGRGDGTEGGRWEEPDNPGVIAFPPLIFLAFFAAGALLEWSRPTPGLPDAVAYPAAGVAVVAALAMIIAARRRFEDAGTNVEPSEPATAVVTDGIYGRTRNPMYLGVALGHVGLAVALGFLWAVGAVVPALLVIHYGVVRREERYLERKFGEPYLRYKGEVRRWL